VAVVVEEVEVEGVVEVGVVEVVVEVVGVSLVLSVSEGESLAGEGAAAESETFFALTLIVSFMPPWQ